MKRNSSSENIKFGYGPCSKFGRKNRITGPQPKENYKDQKGPTTKPNLNKTTRLGPSPLTSNPNTRLAVRPTSRSKPAKVAATVSTYAGERTLLTGHYRNKPHRDKPDPKTYQHSPSPPSCTPEKSLPARSIAGARSSPPPFEHTPE
ncbi:hypothetical protein YC2023_071159 [Brassica napus]